MKKCITGELKTQVVITKAFKINRGRKSEMIIAQIQDWDQKQNIMKSKNKLKGIEVEIENDLTWKKIEIQKRIVGISREEKGSKVNIGYKKIWVDGQQYIWNEENQGLKKQKVVQKER